MTMIRRAAEPYRGVIGQALPRSGIGRVGSVAVLGAGVVAGAAAASLSGPALATGVTAAALVPAVVFDVRERRIPTGVVYPAAIAVAGVLLLAALVRGDWGRLGVAALASAVAVAALTAGWLLGGVGFGDVRLGGLVSLTAGWHGAAVVVAMWWWAAVAALLPALVARMRGRRTIPFAPAMAVGWVVVAVGVA